LHVVQVKVSDLITVRHDIRYDTKCYFNVRSKADMSQLNLPHVKRHFVLKLSSGNKHGHTRTHPTDCVTRPLERSPTSTLKTHCFDVTANIKSFRIDRRMASIGSLNAGGWAMRVGGRVVEGTWEREAKQQRLMGTLTARHT